ncbi:MAG: hypothetical protein CL583_00910 [Alteromonadaceae bacterium]|nr:hypothetical protein [Alteromonadaceae bacterium]
MTRKLFHWVVLLVALGQASTLAAETIMLDGRVTQFPLGAHIEYLEDVSGILSTDQVRQMRTGWEHSERDVLSFGYSASTYWIRFGLTHSGTGTMPYLLEVAYPVLDHVDVHIFQDDEQIAHYSMGDRVPYSQRPVDHPNYIAPLHVEPNRTTEVYLRIQSSSSIQVPLALYHDLSLVETNFDRGVTQALFYGAMLVMVLYNLLIFFTTRDISYLYYVMSVVSISTLLAGIEGLTFKYIWPDSTWLNDSSLVVALSGMVFFSALFFRSFLAIPRTRPFLGNLLLMFAMLSAVTAVGAFVLPYRLMMLVTIVLAICAILTAFSAGIIRWRDGFHAARYLNVAWSCMLVAGLLLALNKLGFLPRNSFTENVVQIGAGFQTLLLSFALAHRMTYERDMREKAQQESAAAQQNLLQQQVRANEDLDHMVRRRTEELEQANIKLKEIGSTDGLTNLLNRRAFEEIFLVEYKRAYRGKSPLAILMIDLDHFKKINDTYGHPFGDLCLIKAASLIQGSIRRPPDVAARYGGEEFIVMLPDTDVKGAVCVATNILKDLSGTEIRDGALVTAITASIGVTAAIPDSQSNRDKLLKDADQNLYAAKEKGRNRVEWQAIQLINEHQQD